MSCKKSGLDARCVTYYGTPLTCINVISGDSLDTILGRINAIVCGLVSGIGVTSADAPLIITGSTISIPKADGFTDGYLSSVDWNIFNNKENYLGTPISDGYILSSDTVGNRTWIPNASGGGIWGTITGTLSDQTDLQAALDTKQDVITTGTTSQYFRGDLSLA